MIALPRASAFMEPFFSHSLQEHVILSLPILASASVLHGFKCQHPPPPPPPPPKKKKKTSFPHNVIYF
jgi:hypothetical protein